jgi:hypothetical protein
LTEAADASGGDMMRRTPPAARFRLSDLSQETPVTELVRLAKIRWHIEHDHRELKP